MKKYFPNVFVSLILIISVLSPVYAEESPQFSYSGPLDAFSVPMLLDASTIIEFDNSNICTDWDTLTTSQQNTITSNIGLNDFNLSVLTTDNSVLLGKAIWCSSYSNGVYQLHGQSNVSNPGFYLVNQDGSLNYVSETQTLSFKSIFYSIYDAGSIWFEDYDIRYTDCSVTNNPIMPPNVTLPTPNEPNITSNVEQSTYINSISSPVTQGAVINYFRYDYFNIYAVHSTAINQEVGYNTEDLLIKYQMDSTGRYLIPVYDHSEVVIYGPNLTISTSGLQITPSLYSGVSYSFPNSNGIIQRDINRFDYTYVDLQMLNQYPYEDLPFSNSNTNTGKVDYLGQQLSVRSGGTGSRSIMLQFNGLNYSTTFYIVSTDSFKDIEQAKQEQNQTIINNNIISNFNQLDNTLQHGNALTQGSKNDLDIIDSQFNSSYDRYQSIEQGLIDDYNNNLDSIDLDTYKITNNLDLLNTANFVRTQFDRLTLNNPFGLVLGFSLCVGLALLLIGKRL